MMIVSIWVISSVQNILQALFQCDYMQKPEGKMLYNVFIELEQWKCKDDNAFKYQFAKHQI